MSLLGELAQLLDDVTQAVTEMAQERPGTLGERSASIRETSTADHSSIRYTSAGDHSTVRQPRSESRLLERDRSVTASPTTRGSVSYTTEAPATTRAPLNNNSTSQYARSRPTAKTVLICIPDAPNLNVLGPGSIATATGATAARLNGNNVVVLISSPGARYRVEPRTSGRQTITYVTVGDPKDRQTAIDRLAKGEALDKNVDALGPLTNAVVIDPLSPRQRDLPNQLQLASVRGEGEIHVTGWIPDYGAMNGRVNKGRVQVGDLPADALNNIKGDELVHLASYDAAAVESRPALKDVATRIGEFLSDAELSRPLAPMAGESANAAAVRRDVTTRMFVIKPLSAETAREQLVSPTEFSAMSDSVRKEVRIASNEMLDAMGLGTGRSQSRDLDPSQPDGAPYGLASGMQQSYATSDADLSIGG